MKVKTGKCRASYVNVFKPKLNTFRDVEEYSIVLLIPKSDTETIAKIKTAIQDAVFEKWGNKPPSNLKLPLRDGDIEKPDQDGYAGNFFITAKSRSKPSIIDLNRNEVTSDFISGDYCKAMINSYTFNVKGNIGVAFGLNSLLVVGKGDPLSNQSRAEEDFSEEINNEFV